MYWILLFFKGTFRHCRLVKFSKEAWKLAVDQKNSHGLSNRSIRNKELGDIWVPTRIGHKREDDVKREMY